MTYMYEVTVTIPPGRYLDVPPGDSGIINVEGGEHPTRLSVPTDDDETRLYLTGQGFPSAEGAREAAAVARSALRLAALAADVPMNVGSGGDVRIQRSSALNLRARAVGRVHRPAGEFVDHVRTALNAEREIGAKEALAIDLFLAASFESSIRARFVTLVTALEALSARQARPDAVTVHVDHLRELTAEAMRNADSGEERESYDRLCGALAVLQEESITHAIRTIVAEHVPSTATFAGKPVRAFVTQCYSVRSDLVHDGEAPDAPLPELHDQLRRLIRDVLVSVAGIDHSER